MKKIAQQFTALLAGLILLSSISGCSIKTFKYAKHTKAEQDLSLVTQSGETQSTIVKKTKQGPRFCMGTPPDAVKTHASGLSINNPVKSSDEVENADGAVALGGRNPAALITRELMYRACEISLNYNLNAKEARELYTEFLNAAKAIASTQTAQGVAGFNAQANTIALPPPAVTVNNSATDQDSSSSDDSDDGDDD